MSVAPFGQKDDKEDKNVKDDLTVHADIEKDKCQYCKEIIEMCRCSDVDDQDQDDSRDDSQNDDQNLEDYFEDEDPDYLTDLYYRKTEEMY